MQLLIYSINVPHKIWLQMLAYATLFKWVCVYPERLFSPTSKITWYPSRPAVKHYINVPKIQSTLDLWLLEIPRLVSYSLVCRQGNIRTVLLQGKVFYGGWTTKYLKRVWIGITYRQLTTTTNQTYSLLPQYFSTTSLLRNDVTHKLASLVRTENNSSLPLLLSPLPLAQISPDGKRRGMGEMGMEEVERRGIVNTDSEIDSPLA